MEFDRISLSGTTKVVGLLGGVDQVQSSLSPAIHNAAFRALNLNWVYIPLPSVEPSIKEVLRGLAGAGLKGINVTMPYKLDVAAEVDELEGMAKTIGAVNTVSFSQERLVGWNTDGDGLLRFLRKDVGATITGRPALVVGSGGAARAVVAALGQAGASPITLAVRDIAHAEDFPGLAGKAQVEVVRLASRRKKWIRESSLIVNASPVGQKGEPPPIPTKDIRRGSVVVDLVYNPPTTPLIEGARARGAVAHNGLGMLLHQAALSFEIWTGVQPPLEDMSAAALAELRK